MSKKDKALKLSLEALETEHSAVYGTSRTARAITAIREALAEQSAQPIKQGWDVDTLLNKPKQPAQQQEPVATVTSESGNPNVSMSWWHEPALPVGTKLYTSPPASKPWVGLTDEEKADLFEGTAPYYNELDYANDIEAKLKEKNA